MSADDPTPRSQADDGPTDGPAVGADGDSSNRDRHLGRRTFVKGLGAAGAATVGLSADDGFAQDAEAVAPLVGAAVVGGSVAVGWALREFEILGADAPPEGLSPDALKQEVYQRAKTRQSTNQSTLIDNSNILSGAGNNAWIEAKTAAIEALNAEKTETQVLDAAQAAVDDYHTTVKRNLLNSWNEAVSEVDQMVGLLESSSASKNITCDAGGAVEFNTPTFEENPHTLPNGNSMTLKMLRGTNGADFYKTDPTEKIDESGTAPGTWGVEASYDGNSVNYLDYNTWNTLFNDIDTAFVDVRDGVSLWVDNVYGSVQAGEIEIADLVTPRQRAAMMADQEGGNQAIADLIALNISVDPEREATVTFDSTGVTLSGTFGLSDASDGPLTSNTSYDPANFTGDVYFTADMSLVEGEWTSINSDITDGVITITAEPYGSTAIEVSTGAGETVSVPAADWTESSGTWTYDATPDLETVNTTVDTASFASTATETQYETIRVTGAFTIEEFINTQTGETATETTFTKTTVQDDSNYITQEEWDQLEQQNKELIEEYEQSQSGGGLDLGGLDMFGVPGEIVAVGAAAVVGFLTLNN